MKKQTFSRRDFLKYASIMAGAAGLAACAPAVATVAPQPTVALEKATEAPTEAVKATEVPAPTAAPVQEQVKLTVWDDSYAPDAAGTPDANLMDALHEKFFADNPDVAIDFQPLPAGTEIRKAFIESNAGGTAPDLFFVYVPSMNPYIDQKFLLELDNYVSLWDQKSKVYDSLWSESLVNGHYYGIPRADAWYGMTLFYRKDLFKEAGLESAPQNWDEIVEFGKKLTIADKKQAGFGLLGMSWASWYWENFVWQADGEVTKRLPDGQVELSFTDEPAVQALQYYQDLKYKHEITQTDVMQEYEANMKDLLEGRTAMYMMATDAYGYFFSNGLTLDELGCVVLPAGPNGKKAAQLGGGYWTISPAYDQARKDASWKYIEWRNNTDNLIFKYEKMGELGVTPRVDLPVYQGFVQTDYQDVPDEWVKVAAETVAVGRMEYVYKDKLDPYLALPVQQVLTDPGASCAQVLNDAAKKAVGEVANTVLASSAS